MVHADHDEPSFFLSSALPTTPNFFRIGPPTEAEVFAYLDAHPGALQRYLTRAPVGAIGSFSPTLAEGASLPQAASENEVQPIPDAPVFFGDIIDGFEDVGGYLDVDADQAVGEWEFLDSWTDGELIGADEVYPQAGPEVPSDGSDSSVDAGDDDVAGDIESGSSVEDQGGAVVDEALRAGPEKPSDDNGTTTAMNNDAAPATNEDLASDGAETASAHNNADNDETTIASPNAAEVDPDFIPYPAPAHLIAESRGQPPTRSWSLWEQDSCIRHMLDINNEGQLVGEARFREALRRMRVYDNSLRNGANAVKNFWNRVGRARSAFDERRNKNAPLATSKQATTTRNGRGVSTTCPSRPTKQRKIKTVPKSRNTTKTRQHTPTTSDEEDEESDFVLESDNDEPEHIHHSRKRKYSPEEDSEDERAPDTATVNAVAKGLRPPKRMRSTTAC